MTFSSVDVIHGWKVLIKMMDEAHGRIQNRIVGFNYTLSSFVINYKRLFVVVWILWICLIFFIEITNVFCYLDPWLPITISSKVQFLALYCSNCNFEYHLYLIISNIEENCVGRFLTYTKKEKYWPVCHLKL